MPSKGKTLLEKWIRGWTEVLFFFPLWFALAIYTIPEALQWLWLGSLPFFHLCGLLLGQFIARYERWVHLLIGLVIVGTYSFALFGDPYVTAISTVVGLFYVNRGVLLVENEWSDIFPQHYMWLGVIIYVIAQLYFLYFTPHAALIMLLGLLVLMITLVTANTENLKAIIAGKRQGQLSSRVKAYNRFYIVLTLLITILIVGLQPFQAVWQLAQHMLHMFLSSLGSIPLSFFAADGGGGESTFDGGVPIGGGAGEWDEGMSLFARIVLIIVLTMLATAILAILYFLGWRLVRWIRWLYTYLRTALSKKKQGETESGIVDQKISLWDFKRWGAQVGNRFREWLSRMLAQEKRWHVLTSNRARIRFLYRLLLLKQMQRGYAFKKHLTPGETRDDLHDSVYKGKWAQRPSNSEQGTCVHAQSESKLDTLVRLYNRTRYSKREIADEEMKNMHPDSFKE